MDPFLRDDSADLGDMVTDAAVRVLDEDGAPGLSVSAIARRLRITPQAVTQRLAGPQGARRRVLQLATVKFGRRWIAWTEDALLEPLPLPALPSSPEEMRGARAWWALHELARSEVRHGNTHVGEAVSAVRGVEREMVHRQLERWLGVRLPEVVPIRLCAVTDGLRHELIAPSPALDVELAGAIIRQELERIRAEQPALPATASPPADLPYM